MQRFTGKTVIVTGASSGIGRGIAERFAAEGANLAIVSRSREDLEAVAKGLDAARTLIVPGSVADDGFAEALVRRTVERFGALDTLVNNAGVATFGPLVEVADEDIDRLFAVNVKAVIRLCRAAVPELVKTSGSIVNTSSVSGIGGDWALSVYNASKGAVTNLTRSLALELGAEGVRVNAVLPSVTRSNMSAGLMDNEPLMEAFRQRIALGRIGEPEDVAGPVAFLASEDARFVTGVNLPVDGGLSASNGQPNFTAYPSSA